MKIKRQILLLIPCACFGYLLWAHLPTGVMAIAGTALGIGLMKLAE